MPALKIDLSEDTITACEERIEGTEVGSVDAYVAFVVSEVVAGDEVIDISDGEVDQE